MRVHSELRRQLNIAHRIDLAEDSLRRSRPKMLPRLTIGRNAKKINSRQDASLVRDQPGMPGMISE
jgi:hypothetical protein